ncbi:ATP-binding protein [Natronomonas marina]|uniref:ATP-binding protein n=1 Tax=Natronomonas marina TaxID=2961939 RepID=UPI0020C99B07|nr:ATP-binding protein [Natronomonas marina]
MTDDYVTEHDLREHHTHTDGQEIRKTFGIAPFWKLEEQFEDYEHPLPDCIIHTRDGSEWGHPGGTNWLAIGGKGSGKSTLALWLASHLLDVNGETVVWRGAEARSEWLPFKRWTTLYLPAGCAVEAVWRPENAHRGADGEPADLENVVREVKRYHGVVDLLEQLDEHEFAVVYPDPEFRGCNDVMQDSQYVQQPITYQTEEIAGSPEAVTPLVHWWIAFSVARVEGYGGHFDWTSLIFDEIADLLPQSARADETQTYQKLEVMRKVVADSRKYGFSLFGFGQDETNVHEKVRRTFQWRVAMPDDDGNPCKRQNDRAPVGFSSIPMVKNFLKRKDAGFGICWKPNNFTRFVWDDIPDWEEDVDRKLKISLVDDQLHTRGTESNPDAGDSRREEVADD